MEKGKYLRTPEIREKNRIANLGQVSWLKGRVSPLKGKKTKPLSKEQKIKISNAMKGRRLSFETRRKIGESCKGKTFGEKHYKWKGGIQRSYDGVYLGTKYNDWRRKIMDRDLYMCVICKVTGKRLQVDHIYPRCLYPQFTLSLENGRTLCVDCHKETPTYGLNKQWMLNSKISQVR